MSAKIRSPILAWILTIISSGIYVFLWVHRVCNEINQAERKVIFNISVWKKILGLLFIVSIITMGLFIQTPRPDSPELAILFSIFTITIIFYLYVQIKIGAYIKQKQISSSISGNYSNILSILLFWIFIGTGIIYMQLNINRIIESEDFK
jgi:hypothetical protein